MSRNIRKKRNKITRAFAKGYQIGNLGKSKDLCPYTEQATRQSWLNGWRSGREDHWLGLTGTAGVCVNQEHASLQY